MEMTLRAWAEKLDEGDYSNASQAAKDLRAAATEIEKLKVRKKQAEDRAGEMEARYDRLTVDMQRLTRELEIARKTRK